MKRYHILFFETKDSVFSTGKDYNSNTMSQAVYEFELEHPNAIILNVASEEMFNYKY